MSTTDGELFGTGLNEYGELGCAPTAPNMVPVSISIAWKENVDGKRSLAAGQPRLYKEALPPDHLLCCGDQCSFVVINGRVFAAGLTTEEVVFVVLALLVAVFCGQGYLPR